MNESSITNVVQKLFEQHFFSVVDWLSEELRIPAAFLRYPSYPGISVAVDGQRVLDFNFLHRPLSAQPGNYAGVMATEEAACFAPYLSRKGPMVTIDSNRLAVEAQLADVPETALLEILVLHEMVHVCMMGSIAQRYETHAWIVSPEFRYIHEAAALKASEFGFGSMLPTATPQHVARYLSHIQLVSNNSKAGESYKPYFDIYPRWPG